MSKVHDEQMGKKRADGDVPGAGRITRARLDLRAGVIAALAGKPGYQLDKWLAATFNRSFDEYDRAIDAVYNATRVGGSQLHHLVDGQHSIWGAMAAVKDVRADDGFAREVMEAGEHLLRDTGTVSGTNVLFQLTPEQFGRAAEVAGRLGMPRSYLADMLMVNGSELLGGAIGLAAAVVVGRRGRPEDLSRVSGAMLLSSVASANPVLLGVAGGALVYALHTGEWRREQLVEAGKGALVSGAVLLTTGLVGGPVWLGLLVGMGAAVVAGRAADDPEKAYRRLRGMLAGARRVIEHVHRYVQLAPEEAQ